MLFSSMRSVREVILRPPFFVLFVTAAAYMLLSYLSFKVPQTIAAAELCGFVTSDFTADGALAYPPIHAWWLSFLRKQEYWTTLSIGLSFAFVAYALQLSRRAKAMRIATGAALSSGLLALSALCISCLAPILSTIGLGLAGTLLLGVPKWLIACNTLLLTGWGSLLLSRRLSACPLPVNPTISSANENKK